MNGVLLVRQASNGALSARRFSTAGPASLNSAFKLRYPPSCRSGLGVHSRYRAKLLHLMLAADGEPGPSSQTKLPPFIAQEDVTVFVGDEGVPLEGVFQFDKSSTPPLLSWAILGLLAGGDVLCLLAFSAIGWFSHGLPIVDFETFKTADPFIACLLVSFVFAAS